MLLRQLFEAPTKEASFALGRMNPAHRGHALLVEAIKQGPGDAFLFLTDRPAKLPTDPLSPQEKLDWAEKSFPDINVSLAKNVFPVAVELYKKGYTDITIFEGEDKLRPLLEKYNGTEATHGFFQFNSINQKKLSRDASADDASGASATKLRQAAMDGDYDTFEANVTKSAKPFAKKMFEKLQGILGNENTNEIFGFATTSGKKHTVKRRPPEPEEPSIQDKIKRRRALASKVGTDKAFRHDAFGTKKKDENLDEIMPAVLTTLRYGGTILKLGKFLWNNKWLISFSLVAWKGISWISDAIEFVQGVIDHPIVKGLLKYGLPAVGVAIAIYGGKKLYDELTTAEKEGKSRKEMTNIIKDFKPDNAEIAQIKKEIEADLATA